MTSHLSVVEPPKDSASPIVGIDLGTTNSLVSILQAGRPIILPNSSGQRLTSSAVSVGDEGDILIGEAALARRTTHPDETVTAFKRDMGTDRMYQLAAHEFSPQQLSAMIIKSLVEDAEAALGRSIEEAVITVPAYFDESQRRATKDAAVLAGIRADRIINEPTAAAMAYGMHEMHREFKAAVLDLGGGTFDVTVLEIIEGVIEIQSSAGDSRLGGEDFVDAMTDLFARRTGLEDLREDRIKWARLRTAVEQTKRRLSFEPASQVALANFPSDGQNLVETVTRTEAEEVFSDLLRRMRRSMLRALNDAGLSATDIDEILLVGGATRMPCVSALAAEVFGRVPDKHLPPDEAVAMGAAVQAALKARDAAVEDLVVTDVAPFSMGIATGSHFGRRLMTGMFTPVLERGTVIPASREESFTTLSDKQTEMEIEVFQGEHSLCRDNKKLGAFTIKGLPPRPAGECEVLVRFTYDLNGLLEVEATVADTGHKKAVVLTRASGRMDESALTGARARLQKLKFHPRDALPNQTALSRAEALFVDLTGDARQQLGLLQADFRAALESQDRDRIKPAREELLAFVSSFAHKNPD